MRRVEQKDFIKILNSLGLLFICAVLASAFFFQLVKHELPCPLCLLQRLGLILAGFGFYFNLHMDYKASNYGLVIFGAIITSAIAIRQILLHIMPGDPGYGSPLLGLHFYTWSLISSVFIMFIVIGVMILSDLSREFVMPQFLKKIKKPLGKFVCLFFALLVIGNLFFSFLECGFQQCPANPTSYLYLFQ